MSLYWWIFMYVVLLMNAGIIWMAINMHRTFGLILPVSIGLLIFLIKERETLK